MEQKQPPPRDFPTDLLPGFLSKLPVKSLLRFRSVSKTWGNTIHDPKFIKSYRKRPESQISFVRLYTDKDPENVKCTVTCRKTFDVNDQHCFPSELQYRSEVICCIDGLFLFESFERQAIIWNPSIRTTRILPRMPQEMEGRNGKFLGIGFDQRVGDYKCVMSNWDMTHAACRVLVYMFRADSWKMIPFKTKGDKPWRPFTFGLGFDVYKTCYRGALYWTGMKSSNTSIMFHVGSFDLSTEEFSSYDMPELDVDNIFKITWQLKCASDDSRLALVGLTRDRGWIWWAQGEGCDITWSKGNMFTSTLPRGMDSYLDVNISGRSEGGDEVDVELLLWSGSSLMWFNLQSHEKSILLDNSPYNSLGHVSVRSNPYVESLLLLS